MSWLKTWGRGSSIPRFGGPTPVKEFASITGLSDAHLDRFEGEGVLHTQYVRGKGRLVTDADGFVRNVMSPPPPEWPPQLPVLDHELEDAYVKQGGSPSLAARILDPFRFQSLGELWASVVELARPSVRLIHAGAGDIGDSRIGGVPDVPADFVWPHFGEAPLGFVMQVNLDQLQASYPTKLLPGSGTLSFFYDALHEAWGFRPEDKGRWAVLHLMGPLEHAIPPASLPREAQYNPVWLNPVGELTLPEFDSLEIERLGFDTTQKLAYSTLSGELEAARQARGPIHRLLGWPEQVQHDPAVEVQLPAHGLYSGDGSAYASDEGKRLMAERDIWQLLLQVDTDDAASIMWGDVGRIYYMLQKKDLADGDFGESWFTFQCG